ncbi:MAG: ATP-dependent RNA helicase HrpA [Polyangiaceae bacterium]
MVSGRPGDEWGPAQQGKLPFGPKQLSTLIGGAHLICAGLAAGVVAFALAVEAGATEADEADAAAEAEAAGLGVSATAELAGLVDEVDEDDEVEGAAEAVDDGAVADGALVAFEGALDTGASAGLTPDSAPQAVTLATAATAIRRARRRSAAAEKRFSPSVSSMPRIVSSKLGQTATVLCLNAWPISPRRSRFAPVALTFPEELPISARVVDIAKAIDANQVVIIAGETGSGKTTQLPKICLAMGRGVDRRIAVTQPRRIAATSVATRVAQELGSELGQDVGYKIRFDDRLSKNTYVAFMTDGILLAEIQGDPLLEAYDTIIVDEAHERSLNIDFLIGYLKRLLPKRPDLRVVISSATLEVERFRKLFGDVPLISVEGRTFPVDVIYRPRAEEEVDLTDSIATTVEEISSIDPRGDILVFLPGEREIREAADELSRRSLRHTQILPLYGRLAGGDQSRVFESIPQRKIVLATNVAETSLTIPGIVFVIDAGLARVNRYVPRTGVTQLQIEPISKASADQRKGRCGRVRSGVCFRLCTEQEHNQRSNHTDPEILRTGLASVLLRMKAQKLGDIEHFPFLDAPSSKAVNEGFRVLEELGALDDKRELTPIGAQLARFPIDPRLARMILAADKEGSLAEVLVIAAALGIQDPRERPATAQREADEAQKIFRDETSDFLGWLKLWKFFDDAQAKSTKAQLRKLCRDRFLSYIRMNEWRELHQQLSRIARDVGLKPSTKAAEAHQIHRALLPGLLSRIGMWNKESKSYVGARQTKFALHPSSGLAKKPPAWVMVAELVETSQLFARHAAVIFLNGSKSSAHTWSNEATETHYWEQKTARVSAREQVTLYGLPISKDRRVDYGAIDPPSAHRIFIEHALVRGEYHARGAFQTHNEKIFDEARRLRDKARRSDMLADESTLTVFFEQRVPDHVVDERPSSSGEQVEKTEPKLLFLTLADVLLDEANELTPERYPSKITIDGVDLHVFVICSIHPTMPMASGGCSALAFAASPEPALLDAMVPGWMLEKVTALLHALPRGTKRDLGSILDLAARIYLPVCPLRRAACRSESGHRRRDQCSRAARCVASRRDGAVPSPALFRIIDGRRSRRRDGPRSSCAAQEFAQGVRARDAWREAGAASWRKPTSSLGTSESSRHIGAVQDG